jgi:hypothetical protein
MGIHWTLSAEAKKHIRDAVIGRRWSEEAKQRVRDSWTPERRKKSSIKFSGKNNPFFGRILTAEHKAKIKETREKTKKSWSSEKLARVTKINEVINSPRPVCQKCGCIIRRHNKTGMCREHKSFSDYVKQEAGKNGVHGTGNMLKNIKYKNSNMIMTALNCLEKSVDHIMRHIDVIDGKTIRYINLKLYSAIGYGMRSQLTT